MYEQTIDFDGENDVVSDDITDNITSLIEPEYTTSSISIFKKPFDDYSVSESYLLIISLLFVVMIFVCFISKRR